MKTKMDCLYPLVSAFFREAQPLSEYLATVGFQKESSFNYSIRKDRHTLDEDAVSDSAEIFTRRINPTRDYFTATLRYTNGNVCYHVFFISTNASITSRFSPKELTMPEGARVDNQVHGYADLFGPLAIPEFRPVDAAAITSADDIATVFARLLEFARLYIATIAEKLQDGELFNRLAEPIVPHQKRLQMVAAAMNRRDGYVALYRGDRKAALRSFSRIADQLDDYESMLYRHLQDSDEREIEAAPSVFRLDWYAVQWRKRKRRERLCAVLAYPVLVVALTLLYLLVHALYFRQFRDSLIICGDNHVRLFAVFWSVWGSIFAGVAAKTLFLPLFFRRRRAEHRILQYLAMVRREYSRLVQLFAAAITLFISLFYFSTVATNTVYYDDHVVMNPGLNRRSVTVRYDEIHALYHTRKRYSSEGKVLDSDRYYVQLANGELVNLSSPSFAVEVLPFLQDKAPLELTEVEFVEDLPAP